MVLAAKERAGDDVGSSTGPKRANRTLAAFRHGTNTMPYTSYRHASLQGNVKSWSKEALYRNQQRERARLYENLSPEDRAKFDATPDAPSYRRKQRVRTNDPRVMRRRRLATRSNLPPNIADQLTFCENALLVILVSDNKTHGRCERSVKEKADIAGMSKSSVRAAERLFVERGWIKKTPRPHKDRKSDTNIITIISPELRLWIDKNHGCKISLPSKIPFIRTRVEMSQNRTTGAYNRQEIKSTPPP